MDPITAWAIAVGKVADMITEIVRGQPPEVRAKVWDWWIKDQERWRKFLKLDDEPRAQTEPKEPKGRGES